MNALCLLTPGLGGMLVQRAIDLRSGSVFQLPHVELIAHPEFDTLDRAKLHGHAMSVLLYWARVLRRMAHGE